MRKMLSLLTITALTAAMLAGCSGPAQAPETTAAPVTAEKAAEETKAEGETAAEVEVSTESEAAKTIDQMIAEIDHDITVGISLFNYSNNWCSWQRNAMLNWFDQCGNEHIQYYMSDAQNDQAKQNDAVDTMLARGVDVLIYYVVQSSGASAIAQKCEAAGVPVIFLNTKVDGPSLSDFQRTWFIGADNESKAHMQMDMIFELLDENFDDVDKNGDGKINMFYIQGPPNEDMSICYETVKARIAESKYKDTLLLLEQQNSNNSTANCKEIADAWVGKYDDDIELTLAHTDAQAAGAIASYMSAGLLSEEGGVYVLASNCLPDAQVYIRDGVQYASVLTDPWWQGTTCIKMALSAAMGNDQTYGDLLYGFDEDVKFSEKNPKIVYIVLTGITQNNVELAKDAYDRATRED